MPKRKRDRVKACESKRRYASSSEAEEMARHRREESGQQDIDIYPCPFCHGWHLGHSQPRPRRGS